MTYGGTCLALPVELLPIFFKLGIRADIEK